MARAAWESIVGSMPPGLYGRADAFMLEIAVTALEDFRTASTASERAKAGALFISASARLGLSPADRSRLTMPEQREVDEWAAKVS
jgi:hypothetical protein